MKKIVFTGILSLSLLHAQNVDEIIQKHIEATGGESLYAGMKSVQKVQEIEMGPGMKAPYVTTILDKKGSRAEFTMMGQTQTVVVTPEYGWEYSPFGGKREADPMTPENVKISQDQLDVSWDLYNYKAKGYVAEYVGDEDVEGVDVYKLRVTLAPGIVHYHFIDKETGLALKMTSKVKLADKEQESTVIFSDYKKTSYGTIEPHFISFGENGMGGMTIKEIKYNIPVDEKIFALPENLKKAKQETKAEVKTEVKTEKKEPKPKKAK